MGVVTIRIRQIRQAFSRKGKVLLGAFVKERTITDVHGAKVRKPM